MSFLPTLFSWLPVAQAAPTLHTAPNQPASHFTAMLPMMAVFMGVFYLLLVRPQHKRAQQQKALIDNLSIGDEVLTQGGLVGTIKSMDDTFLVLHVANNTPISLQKKAIVKVYPKGTLSTLGQDE